MEGVTCPRCSGEGRSYWTEEKHLQGVYFYELGSDGEVWFICMECGAIFTEEGKINRDIGEL